MTDDFYISGDYSGLISIYDLNNLEQLPTEIKSHTDQVNIIILDRKQKKVITGSSDRLIKVIDLHAKKEMLGGKTVAEFTMSVMGLNVYDGKA